MSVGSTEPTPRELNVFKAQPVRCRLCRFFVGTLFFFSARSCAPRTPLYSFLSFSKKEPTQPTLRPQTRTMPGFFACRFRSESYTNLHQTCIRVRSSRSQRKVEQRVAI